MKRVKLLTPAPLPWPDEPADCLPLGSTIRDLVSNALREVGGERHPGGWLLGADWSEIGKAQALAFDALRIPYEWLPFDEYAGRRVELEPLAPVPSNYGLTGVLDWWLELPAAEPPSEARTS